jgi:hypothetical protein
MNLFLLFSNAPFKGYANAQVYQLYMQNGKHSSFLSSHFSSIKISWTVSHWFTFSGNSNDSGEGTSLPE